MCIRLVDAALFISERLTAGTQEHVHHIVFEPDRTPHAVSVICLPRTKAHRAYCRQQTFDEVKEKLLVTFRRLLCSALASPHSP